MFPAFRAPIPGPLCYETAAYRREDIICIGSDDEDGQDERRTVKRRRIEDKAYRVLAGEDVFILTASLKGPFERAWINPWAKSESSKTTTAVQSSPANQQLVHLSCNELSQVQAEKHGATPVDPIKSIPIEKVFSHQSLGTGSPARSSPTRGKQDWLRKSDRNRDTQINHHSASPPPVNSSKYLEAIESSHLQGLELEKNARKRRRKLPLWQNEKEIPRVGGTLREIQNDVGRSPTKKFENRNFVGNDQLKSAALARTKPLSQSSPKPALLSVTVKGQEQVEGGLQRRGRISTKRFARKDRSAAEGAAGEAKSKSKGLVKKRALFQTEPESDNKRSNNYALKNLNTKLAHVISPKPAVRMAHQLPSEVATDYVSISSGSSSTSSSDDDVPFKSVDNVVPGKEVENNIMPQLAVQEGSDRARARAIAAAATRLTFTPNGASQLSNYKPLSKLDRNKKAMVDNVQPQEGRRIPKRPASNAAVVPAPHTVALPEQPSDSRQVEPKSAKTSSRLSQKDPSNGKLSKESSNILPEAQTKGDPPPIPAALSKSSTNLLETDQEPLPSPFNEEDSYMNLATQAAVEKARRRFHEDVVADLAKGSRKKDQLIEASPLPELHRTPRVLPEMVMSTQAMMDEMIPFDISTTKKPSPAKKRTTPAKSPLSPLQVPSPLHAFALSSKMSTSSSSSHVSADETPTKGRDQGPASQVPRSPASVYVSYPSSLQAEHLTLVSHAHPSPPPPKPDRSTKLDDPSPATLSPLTSFSIHPDGTFTETRVQQDGQRPEPIIPESYSLPSLDFSKPAPTFTSTNQTSHSSPLKTSHTVHVASTFSKMAPPTPRLDSPTPGTATTTTMMLTHPPADPTHTPINPPGDIDHHDPTLFNPAFLLPLPTASALSDTTTSSSTADRELDAFIDDASSFLADWNIDKEAKRRTPRSQKQGISAQGSGARGSGGRGRGGRGGGNASVMSTPSKSVGKRRGETGSQQGQTAAEASASKRSSLKKRARKNSGSHVGPAT